MGIGRTFKDRSGTCPFGAGEGTEHTTKESMGMKGGQSWTEKWLKFDNSYFTTPHGPHYWVQLRDAAARTMTADEKKADAEAKKGKSFPEQQKMDQAKYEGMLKPGSAEAQRRDELKKGLQWLPTDDCLFTDEAFKKYADKFALDQFAFFEAYGNAHKKLSELGAVWEDLTAPQLFEQK